MQFLNIALALVLCVCHLALGNEITNTDSNKNTRLVVEKIQSISECLRKVLDEGWPEKNIPSFNPLSGNFEIDFDGLNLENVNGKIKLDNLLLNGVTKWEIVTQEKLTLIPITLNLNLTFKLPDFDFKTKYSGNLNEYHGNGDLAFRLQDMEVGIKMLAKVKKLKPLDLEITTFEFFHSFSDIKLALTGFMDDQALSSRISNWVTYNFGSYMQNHGEHIDDIVSYIAKSLINQIFSNTGTREAGSTYGIIEDLIEKCKPEEED